MNWTLPLNTDPDKVIEFVREHGIAVFPGYISDQSLLKQAKEEALNETQKASDGYKFGKAQRYGPNVLNHMPAIRQIISDPRCLKLEKSYGLTRQNVFVTHEYKPDVEWDRNGYLHFDRTFTFKLFFYLSEVDQKCGPFSAIIDTNKLGRELRIKELHKNPAYEGVKNRLALDYPELGYTEDDGVPVLGPAGTLIVFDTDTFHKGGIVQEGHHRIIMRTHNR